MKYIYLVVLLCFIPLLEVIGQTKKIIGKVIFVDPDQENPDSSKIYIQPGVFIFSKDNIELGMTNGKGIFELQVKEEIKQIKFRSVSYETELIQLPEKCETFEIILMPFTRYEFMPYKKADRMKEKDLEIMPKLYELAFKKGLFTRPKPCR